MSLSQDRSGGREKS